MDQLAHSALQQFINASVVEVFGKDTQITKCVKLTGGMVHNVQLLELTKEPYKVVVKASEGDTDPFIAEMKALEYLGCHTGFRVPDVHGKTTSGGMHALFIEYIPGVNMGALALTKTQQSDIEIQLADILIDLHKHTGDCYRDIAGTWRSDDWWPVLERRIQGWYSAIQDRLHLFSKSAIPALLQAAPPHFVNQGPPTMVHGDIWETNIMLVPEDDSYRIAAFVDPSSEFVDVEWELAYLEVFYTVSDGFWSRYRPVHPERPGYQIRKLYYWLNTMLLHVEHFGDQHYIDRTERIVRSIAELTE